MDVVLLDKRQKKTRQAPFAEKDRKEVEKKIDKNGRLKKGSLDKIKSDNANFNDLKTVVNAKETVEVVSSNQDSKAQEFEYETIEEARQSRYDLNIENGMTEEEARADANKMEFNKDRARSIYGGETLTPTRTPGKPGTGVIVPDGTGKTSEMPQSELLLLQQRTNFLPPMLSGRAG